MFNYGLKNLLSRFKHIVNQPISLKAPLFLVSFRFQFLQTNRHTEERHPYHSGALVLSTKKRGVTLVTALHLKIWKSRL